MLVHPLWLDAVDIQSSSTKQRCELSSSLVNELAFKEEARVNFKILTVIVVLVSERSAGVGAPQNLKEVEWHH